jgi:hypothetical protein
MCFYAGTGLQDPNIPHIGTVLMTRLLYSTTVVLFGDMERLGIFVMSKGLLLTFATPRLTVPITTEH